MTRRQLLAVHSAAVLAFGLAACRKPTPGQVDQYNLTGEIIRLEAAGRMAAIKHEAITNQAGKVWMDAMTMEFPVKDPAEFAKLQVGMKLKAKLFQNPQDYEYWIADIQATGLPGLSNSLPAKSDDPQPQSQSPHAGPTNPN